VNVVDIQNEQELFELDMDLIERWTHKILTIMEKDDVELSIVLTDNKHIQELNREYLGRDKPTNVISFPQQEGEGFAGNHLGDVVISVERAYEESLEGGIDMKGRIKQLLVHGICHLSGYNHEETSEDKVLEMEAAEEWVLGQLEEPDCP
jgi:probable rRNA maturation factor